MKKSKEQIQFEKRAIKIINMSYYGSLGQPIVPIEYDENISQKITQLANEITQMESVILNACDIIESK